MNKVLTILEAKLSDKTVLGDWYQKRLDVCSTCEFNSAVKENLTTKDNFIKMMNFGEASCLQCTCEIGAKASVEIEDCGMIKKGLPSKWEKIEINEKSGYSIVNNSKKKVTVTVLDNGINSIQYGVIKPDSDSNINMFVFKKAIFIKSLNVGASCGCTIPTVSHSKDTISLNIAYDTKRIGPFSKSVTLTVNHNDGKVDKVFFNINGEVK